MVEELNSGCGVLHWIHHHSMIMTFTLLITTAYETTADNTHQSESREKSNAKDDPYSGPINNVFISNCDNNFRFILSRFIIFSHFNPIQLSIKFFAVG